MALFRCGSSNGVLEEVGIKPGKYGVLKNTSGNPPMAVGDLTSGYTFDGTNCVLIANLDCKFATATQSDAGVGAFYLAADGTRITGRAHYDGTPFDVSDVAMIIAPATTAATTRLTFTAK